MGYSTLITSINQKHTHRKKNTMAYNWERLLIMYQLFFLFNNILCRHQYFLLSVTLLHILYKKCCKKSFHKYFCRIILQIIVKHKEEEKNNNSQLWLFLSNRPFFTPEREKALILLQHFKRASIIENDGHQIYT